jgi:Cu2+-containing amine oxidase
VKYAPGGCGGANLCFRDWSDEEAVFEAITATGPSTAGPGAYVEVTNPPVTVCETGEGRDIGAFRGVAAERLADRLTLTSQMKAGWYRYTMRWSFFADGRVEGWFGFSAVAHSCVGFAHTHHNYWRLDFDLDGPARDSVEMAPPAALPVPPGPLVVLGREAVRVNEAALTWVVRDQQSGRGYRLLPGTTEPADAFSVADVWFLSYNQNEVTDAGQSGPACAIKFTNYVNQQSVEEDDVVMWVRGGRFHDAGDLDDCHATSFMLQPVGDWSASAQATAAPRPGTR